MARQGRARRVDRVPEAVATIGFLLFAAPIVGLAILGQRQVLVFGLDRYALGIAMLGTGLVLGIIGFGLASARTTNTAAFGFHSVAIVLLVALTVLTVGGYAVFVSADRHVAISEDGETEVVLWQSQAMLGGVSNEVYVRRGLVLVPVGRFSTERSHYLHADDVSVDFAGNSVNVTVYDDSVATVHRYTVVG